MTQAIIPNGTGASIVFKSVNNSAAYNALGLVRGIDILFHVSLTFVNTIMGLKSNIVGGGPLQPAPPTQVLTF